VSQESPARAFQAAEEDAPGRARLQRLLKKSVPNEIAALSGFYETAVEFKGVLLFFYY
jgi:hypothetical protein